MSGALSVDSASEWCGRASERRMRNGLLVEEGWTLRPAVLEVDFEPSARVREGGSVAYCPALAHTLTHALAPIANNG